MEGKIFLILQQMPCWAMCNFYDLLCKADRSACLQQLANSTPRTTFVTLRSSPNITSGRNLKIKLLRIPLCPLAFSCWVVCLLDRYFRILWRKLSTTLINQNHKYHKYWGWKNLSVLWTSVCLVLRDINLYNPQNTYFQRHTF